jgi:hypothetical protein
MARQVQAVFLERLALAFGFGTVHVLSSTHGLDGRFKVLARQALLLGQATCFVLAVGQHQHKQLTGNETVASLDGFFFGRLQQLDQLGPDLHLLLPADLRQALDGGFGRLCQSGHLNARTLQQGTRAVLLTQHGGQHMDGLDVGMVVAQGQTLGVGQGFLEFGGEFVDSHGWNFSLTDTFGRPTPISRACAPGHLA